MFKQIFMLREACFIRLREACFIRLKDGRAG